MWRAGRALGDWAQAQVLWMRNEGAPGLTLQPLVEAQLLMPRRLTCPPQCSNKWSSPIICSLPKHETPGTQSSTIFHLQTSVWYAIWNNLSKAKHNPAGNLPNGGFSRSLKWVVTHTSSVSIFKFNSPFRFASIICKLSILQCYEKEKGKKKSEHQLPTNQVTR